MDTLRSMQVFRRVVEAGSFVTAARRMNLSPAMASKHVMHLEHHLGARLLNRTTRRLSLTEAGRAYYDRCAQALSDLEEAGDAIGAARTTPRGTLRVNSLLSFGMRHVAPMIAEYTARHPQVVVELSLNDRIVDLVEDGYDLAIRGTTGEARPTSLIAREIARLELVACATPEYLARHGTPAAPPDLANHNCLLFLPQREWSFGRGVAQQRIAVSGNLVSDNLDALRSAALSGMGVAYLGTDIIGDDLREGRLQRVLPDIGTPQLSVSAVYPSRRYLSAKVRSFIDFLVERFGGRAM
ncbi:MAG: LysR family transcriptional regulator [Hyphomicrobiaceae bacterium]|nr:LysR family transcriptional regulator [Hyphomicrobiaceae bacterium]